MVQAIIAGQKTITRRTIKNIDPNKYDFGEIIPSQHDHPTIAVFFGKTNSPTEIINCKFGNVGDQLWVKETYGVVGNTTKHYVYTATDNIAVERWKSSMFMPKSAARIFLEITGIGVERVQDISDVDARKEGVSDSGTFKLLWGKINGLPSWNQNSFCWVLKFKCV